MYFVNLKFGHKRNVSFRIISHIDKTDSLLVSGVRNNVEELKMLFSSAPKHKNCPQKYTFFFPSEKLFRTISLFVSLFYQIEYTLRVFR